MSYIVTLTDVTATNNNAVIQVNNADSVATALSGSCIFINGFPWVIDSVDNAARTITLSSEWPHETAVNATAIIIPLGQIDKILTVVAQLTAIKDNYQNILDAMPGLETGYHDGDTATLGSALQAMPPPQLDSAQVLRHALTPYVQMRQVDGAPTTPPNNVREILADPVRESIYFSLLNQYRRMPDVLETRYFLVVPRGYFLEFNSNYTGTIQARVFPLNGGLGLPLPENETLENGRWHNLTLSVTNLDKFGRYNSQYFEGIIDSIRLVNGDVGNWQKFDINQSKFPSLNAFLDYEWGPAASPFKKFHLRENGYWYSEDLLPADANSLGASWTQDASDSRTYHVTAMSADNDALQLFASNTYDEYEQELTVKISSINNPMSMDIENSEAYRVYNEGAYRFLIDKKRIYLKRQNSATPVTATVTFESVKIRVPE